MHKEEGSPEVMHYYLFNCSVLYNAALKSPAWPKARKGYDVTADSNLMTILYHCRTGTRRRVRFPKTTSERFGNNFDLQYKGSM